MHDGDLLELWSRAGGCAGGARATVLAVGLADVQEVATVPVGDLNRALLTAWRERFGDRMDCVATCPGCGERLEFELSVGAMLAAGGPPPVPPAVEVAGRRIELRAPTVADLQEAAAGGSREAARRELLRRCVGSDVELPASIDALAEQVSAALEAADPHTALMPALRCPSCDAGFQAAVDVAAHLWAALDRRARRVVDEVAELARAYGWTEDDVLRLPAYRRRVYVERAGR
jgi:hypothetical protein